MNAGFDFYRVGTELELNALSQYYHTIQSTLPGLIEKEKQRLEAKYGNHLKLSEIDNPRCQVDVVYPGMLWNPFITSVWSVFESFVIDTAGLIQAKKQRTLGIADLSGASLDKAKKYFENILLFDFIPHAKDWKSLQDILLVRNAIIQSNGRTNRLKGSAKKKIAALASKNSGLSIHQDLLVVNAVFAKNALEQVSSSMKDLADRYKVFDLEN